MLTADRVHGILSRFCGPTEAGIAISLDLLHHILLTELKRAETHPTAFKSTIAINNCDAVFSFTVDTSKVTTKGGVRPGPPPRSGASVAPAVVSVLDISNLVFVVTVRLDDKVVFVADLNWDELLVGLTTHNQMVQFSVLKQRAHISGERKEWEADAAIKDYFEKTHAFDNAAWSGLSAQLSAALILAAPKAAHTTVNLLSLPDFSEVFLGLKFVAQLRIEATDDAILLAAPAQLAFDQCPVVRSKGETRVTPSATQNGKPIKIGAGEITEPSNVVVRAGVEGGQYPAINRLPPNFTGETGEGHVFLFTPVDLLKFSFDGAVKPAVNIAKKENWGPFFYRYDVNVSPLGPVGLSLNAAGGQIEFLLSVPLKISGEAGAGIEIACILWEVLGAKFKGTIDPCNFLFTLSFVFERRELVFISRIGNIVCDVQFDAFPDIGFPLNKIVDVVLAAVAKIVIESQGDKILAMTRVPIAAMGIFEQFGRLRTDYATTGDAVGNSTVGLRLDLVAGP